MPPLLIAATTPEEPGFVALRAESLEQHFNMLRRLAENWQSGKNRFNAPGEKLLGAFAISIFAIAIAARELASSCWSRSSRIPAPGSISLTLMPRRRPGPFMNALVSARYTMSRGSRIACSARCKRGWLAERGHVTVR